MLGEPTSRQSIGPLLQKYGKDISMDIEDRVRRLERENTLLKRSIVATALFGIFVLVFSAGKLPKVLAAGAPANLTVGTLTANAIVINSPIDGHKCATLDVQDLTHGNPMAALSFYTKGGGKTVTLFTHESLAALYLNTSSGRNHIVLSQNLAETPPAFPTSAMLMNGSGDLHGFSLIRDVGQTQILIKDASGTVVGRLPQ